MKILKLEIHHIRIPLRIQFAQSNNRTQRSSSVILAITTREGTIGYGECCPRSYVTGESPQSVFDDIRAIKNLLCKQDFTDLGDIKAFLSDQLSLIIGLSSLCAVELALLDAWGKEKQSGLIDELAGAKWSHIHYSGVVPFADEKGTRAILKRLKVFDFKDLKLKVGRDLSETLAKISLIREVFGMEIPLRVDANNLWDYAIAKEQIPLLVERGVNTFEQICSGRNINQMTKITREFGNIAYIMADESLTSIASLDLMLDNGICNYFNLKLSKNGGLFQSLKLYKKISKAGYSCQLGAHFGETSLLSAAGILFSTLTPEINRFEGAYGTHLLESDICSQSIRFDRHASVSNYFATSDLYGLGVEVERSLVDKYVEQ